MDVESIFRRSGAIKHLSLFDPDKNPPSRAAAVAMKMEKEGTDGILIGGSDSLHSEIIRRTVMSVKRRVKLPVMQIIRDPSEITKYADAVLVPVVLNSYDASYCIGIAMGAIHVLKALGVPCIPIGYILIGSPSTASFVTKSIPVPTTRPKVIRQLAIGAEGMGLKALYLEGGSGSSKPVPPAFIEEAAKSTKFPIIVGGGIRDNRSVMAAAKAGADIIVTGSIIEEAGTIKGLFNGAKR
ncbi:MAG: geranylgeranylglyceryl phosphate synthase family protein [Candidatus Micrarchaeales archaeon]|uniref:Geranylgeranylglyceryl phosphate synthase n=1 Tax=Candidatus Micrarchaeum acidiphilum ARMAN-2 TaxID=425595 RepID=C7DGQ8_MICA2|nr:MAG: geranylgeranylglyceryl phosphate synthase family protein [Candidatus Micrarchaeum acidiphilum ARMAN-2]MCW6161543.1 geranylgeranylglyceryl phosphate synthase family protein [Candidatus Micrarchaeales archaeon]